MSHSDVTIFLKFEKWLGKKEHQTQDWIIIARDQKEDDGFYFTYSILASNNEENIKTLLKSPDWEIERFGDVDDFGIPKFEISTDDELIYLSQRGKDG